MTKKTKRIFFLFFCLPLITLGAYWPLLHSDFIGDDTLRIVFAEPFLAQGFSQAVSDILPDRPVLMMTIYFNYLWGGIDPFGHKLLSLIFHFLTGMMFFLVLQSLQKHYWKEDKEDKEDKENVEREPEMLFPAFLTLLFLVHPLNSQALMSVIQRGVILSALGALLSWYFFLKYMREGKNSQFLLAFLFFFLGVLSKPNILTFPLVLFLFARAFHGKDSRGIRVPLILGTVAVIPLFFYHVLKINYQPILTGLLSWPDYLFLQTKVILYYLKLFVYPSSLHFEYDVSRDLGLLKDFWPAPFLHLTAIVLGVVFLRKKEKRALGLCLLSLYLVFLPESGFFPIKHPIFEHRTYFPNIFICFLLFVVLGPKVRSAGRWVIPLMVAVVFAFSVATFKRMEEINTMEKWFLNEYQYSGKGKRGGLGLLNNLFAMGVKWWPQGLQHARELVKRNPQVEEYRIFLGLFSFPQMTKEERKSVLQRAARLLMTTNIDWENTWDNVHLVNFMTSIIRNLPLVEPGPLAYHKFLAPLFQRLFPLFCCVNIPGSDLKTSHLKTLGFLFHYYGRFSLPPEEELPLFLHTLGQLTFYDPKKVHEFPSEFRKMKLAFPDQRQMIEEIEGTYYLSLPETFPLFCPRVLSY